jgi:hypothetical protein
MIRNGKSKARVTSVQRFRRLRSLRARVAAAFEKFAHGVDPRTAGARMKAFYRSSGRAWAQSLS